jgi:hypothetical protein
MLTFLSDLWSVITNLGSWIIYGIETAWNVLVVAIDVFVPAAIALLPSLPSAPGPPSYVEYMNWFFPIGFLVTTITTLVASYVTFLGIRWIFKKAGIL